MKRAFHHAAPGALVVAAGLLTACGQAPSSAVSPAVVPAQAQRSAWMDARARKLDLLYVSQGNGEVAVFSYWQKTLVGELTHFEQPLGECVNKDGDVYIADAGAEKIVEYAHGGSKPLRSIDDAPYTPYACAVDLGSGTLAVANESGGSNGAGNIAVYAGGGGEPTLYSDSQIANFEACVYDDKGNLLATNGQAGGRTSSFAWLPAGVNKLVNISVPGPESSWNWSYVQGLQWDGRYFVLDDYGVYRITIVSGEAYYVGQTSFSANDLQAFWIYDANPKKQGTQVVGGYYDNGYSAVIYWNYPAGGDEIGYIQHGVDDPVALTVSLGTLRE